MSEITLSTLDMLKQELQEHDKNRPPLVKAPELFCEETSKGGLAEDFHVHQFQMNSTGKKKKRKKRENISAKEIIFVASKELLKIMHVHSFF